MTHKIILVMLLYCAIQILKRNDYQEKCCNIEKGVAIKVIKITKIQAVI